MNNQQVPATNYALKIGTIGILINFSWLIGFHNWTCVFTVSDYTWPFWLMFVIILSDSSHCGLKSNDYWYLKTVFIFVFESKWSSLIWIEETINCWLCTLQSNCIWLVLWSTVVCSEDRWLLDCFSDSMHHKSINNHSVLTSGLLIFKLSCAINVNVFIISTVSYCV